MTFFQPNINFLTPVYSVVNDIYNAAFYPYQVEINPEFQSRPLTEKEISEVQCLASATVDRDPIKEFVFGKDNSSFQKRVKNIPGQEGQFIVDKFFRVVNTPERTARAEEVYEKWNSYRVSSTRTKYLGGITAIAGTYLCFRSPSFSDSSFGTFLILSLGFVGGVGGPMMAGLAHAHSQYAARQCIMWKNPGIDFAERRSVALELSLPEMLKQKCRFSASAFQNGVLSKNPLNPVNTKGTLLPIEILCVWKKVFTKLSDSLLTCQPTSLEDRQQWVKEFCTLDILTVEFFKEDPEILQTPAWTEAHQFIKSFQKLKQSIEELQQEISERIIVMQDIQKKIEEVTKDILGKIRKISDLYSVTQIEEYRSLIMEACKLEMEPTLNAVKQEQSRLSCPLATFFPKSRAFLENIRKKLSENQPAIVGLTDGQNPETGNLPSEPLKLDRKILQLILNRAKGLKSSDHEFLSFIDKLSTT
jgi:hypothetical protein